MAYTQSTSWAELSNETELHIRVGNLAAGHQLVVGEDKIITLESFSVEPSRFVSGIIRIGDTATSPMGMMFLVMLPFIMTYIMTFFESRKTRKSMVVGRKAPLLPYTIPGIGHALGFIMSLADLVQKNSAKFSSESALYVPVRFRGMGIELAFISGPKNVGALFRHSRTFAAKASVVIAMDRLFGTPKHIVGFYDVDNTGIDHTIHPESNKIQPHNRVHHIVHVQVIKYLSGPGLKPMTMRLMDNMCREVSLSGIGSEWLDMPDLFDFCQVKLLSASLDAMFGPYLTALNPDFVKDYWKFDKHTSKLLKGFPSWMISDSYKARKKCLDSLKRYNDYAHRLHDADGRQHYEGLDPFFGTEFIRQRHEAFSRMEHMNADAVASECLAIMWAANSNAIPAAFWFLYEIFKDPVLLNRVRTEVEEARLPTDDPEAPPRFDMDILMASPLLQSCYAETLRLRTAVLITRVPERSNFHLGEWLFQRNKMIVAASAVAHMDENVWNTGSREDPHPLNTFWADRFLIHPGAPSSGPLKNAKALRARAPETMPEIPEAMEKPRYTVDGLAGAWVPYGGGQTLCPGRHYAKQEIIMNFAIWSTAFDVEILQDSNVRTDANMGYFGLGVLPPKGATPCRIRKRKQF